MISRPPGTLDAGGFLSRVERWFAGLALIVFANAIFVVLLRGSDLDRIVQVEGDAELRLPLILVDGIIAALLLFRLNRIAPFLFSNWVHLLIVGVAILSTLWSVEPEVTIRRSVALAGTSAFGLYLAWRFTFSECILLLAWSLSMCAVLSIAFVVLLPDVGVMPGAFFEGAWRGVFIHKNILAYNMVWAVTALVLAVVTQERRRTMFIVGIVLTVFVVIQARSAGALVVLATLGPMLFIATLLRRGNFALAIFAAISMATALLTGSLMLDNWGQVLQLLGRGSTLTGRVGVWNTIWTMIQERLWLGYGYGAFWIGLRAESIRALLGWVPAHSHNGWLELWLNLGLLGVALVASSFLAALLIVLHRLAKRGDRESAAYLVFLMVIFTTNLVESRLMQQNALPWVIYVMVTAKCFSRQREVVPANFSTPSYRQLVFLERQILKKPKSIGSCPPQPPPLSRPPRAR